MLALRAILGLRAWTLGTTRPGLQSKVNKVWRAWRPRNMAASASWDDNNRIQLVAALDLQADAGLRGEAARNRYRFIPHLASFNPNPSQDHALLPSAAKPLHRLLVDRIPQSAEVVLIGEASHGTEDFYQARADITKLLIQERGFAAVITESDFPDAFRVNLYVRGMGQDSSAEAALGDFHRFPTWMWRNKAVAGFAGWLREHNAAQADPSRACGYYGMDLYSLHGSAAKVVEYLQRVDPDAAAAAKARYECFDRFGADASSYAFAVGIAGRPSCADAVQAVAQDLARRAEIYGRKYDGAQGREMAFALRCNALVVEGAERYYRNMFGGEDTTWNLRDSHFLEAVKMVRQHLAPLQPEGQPPRVVLWAHNSHLGDARATDMGLQRGELNVGQLCRETWGTQPVYGIGFTTHTGTVTAAHDWDSPGKRYRVRHSLPGSYEYLFHRTGLPLFALDLRRASQDLRAALAGPLLMRHIGVVYRPKTERQSHYIAGSLPSQFDAIIHMDETDALEPLHKWAEWEARPHHEPDAPDTYPFGE